MKLIRLEHDPVEKVYAGLAADAEREVRNYRKPVKRFRASEISRCRRQMWYRLAGFTPMPTEPWLDLVGDAGNMYHDYTRYIMNHYEVGLTGFTTGADGKQKEDKYLVKTFTYDGQTFDVSAGADAGLFLEEIEAQATVEIKSMSFFDFDGMQRAFIKDGEEGVMTKLLSDHINYIWQGNMTAMVKGLDHVYLVLVGRSGNNLGLSDAGYSKQGVWDPLRGRRRAGAVWKIEQEDRENILQKAADISRALDAGDPPPPDFVDGSRDCNQCAMWVYCHGKKKRAKFPIPGVV